ncbi:MAG: ABC transporter substrate-binding protein [Rhodospirillales bacterium]|nr:ABC transporter substrate-binding protein [Rhodospirillales bacterium]
MQRRQIMVGLGAGLATGLAAPAISRAAPPLKIRFGWAITPAQMIPLVFQNTAVLRHYGKSYTAEALHFTGSSQQITALAAGELQIAAFAFSSFALAIQNAHMRDLRVVGDMYQDGVPGHYTSQYVVRADSPIRSVKDLKGKVIATNGVGGAIDMAMRKMLRDNGLEDKRDYSVIEVQFPNMPAMLSEKKVDMAGMVAPYSLQEVKSGRVRSLFTMADAMGVAQTTLLAARTPFIAQNRPALVDFFEDLQTGTRWLLDPANRQATLKLISGFTKRPESVYADWVFTPSDYYHDPDVQPNLKALQNNIKVQKDLGLLRIDLDVARYADTSLVSEAAKRPRA